MIVDQQTTTVYFSNLWPEEDQQSFDALQTIIEGSGYRVKLLIATTNEDYYCRDYMPLQPNIVL